MMLVVLIGQDPAAYETWQVKPAYKPVYLVTVLAQGEQSPLACCGRNDVKPGHLEKPRGKFARDLIIFDNKDRSLGGSRSGEHDAFSR